MSEPNPSTIAHAAVELKLIEPECSEIAFAVMIASMVQSCRAFDLEVLAHRCGITQAVADRIIFDAHHGAALIGEAHRFLLNIAQLGLEPEIERLIEVRRAEKAAGAVLA